MQLTSIRKVASSSATAISILAMAQQPVGAQEQSTTSDDDVIIVTAQKRDQNVQDVPISIRALGATELARIGADSLQGFAGAAPGLVLIEQGPSRTQITMRGVSTGDLRFDRPEVRETVGLYLDEVPISAQVVSPNLGLLDIERIEVLRGPQGTVYGAGSLSGTVRMITRKPELSKTEGNAEIIATTTRFGTENYQGSAVINVPIQTDVVAVRAAGFYRSLGGFIDNVTTGRNNVNWADDYGARVSVRAQPDEQLTADITGVYQKTRIGGEFSYRAELPALNDNSFVREPSSSRFYTLSMVLGYEFEPFNLTSVTAYVNKRSRFTVDASGFSAFFTRDPDDGLTGNVGTGFRQSEFTQELRATSNGNGPLSYTAGLFYQKQNNGFGQTADITGIDAATGISGPDFGVEVDRIFFSEVQPETEQVAIFGEASYEIGSVTLTLGGRYFDVSQTTTNFFSGILNGGDTSNVAKLKESGFNPKANLTWQPSEDYLLYIQAARGFRLGGTNQNIPPSVCQAELLSNGLTSQPEAFNSDSLWSYEGGVKTSWFDDRLTANVAVYQIDWKQPPLGVDLRCGFSTIVNAGSFSITGAEWDLEARPASGVVLRFGGAWNDGNLVGDLPILGGFDGDRVPQTPRLTLNGSMDYDFATPVFGPNSRSFVHVDIQHVGSRVTQFPSNPSASGFFVLPDYQLVNARIGTTLSNVQIELFGENVFDTRAVLNKTAFARAFSKPPGTAIYTNRPRTFGLKLRASF